MRKLSRRWSGPLALPDYSSRRCRRYKECRLARLLSGWPALVEEDAVPVWLVAEPLEQLVAYRGAA